MPNIYLDQAENQEAPFHLPPTSCRLNAHQEGWSRLYLDVL